MTRHTSHLATAALLDRIIQHQSLHRTLIQSMPGITCSALLRLYRRQLISSRLSRSYRTSYPESMNDSMQLRQNIAIDFTPTHFHSSSTNIASQILAPLRLEIPAPRICRFMFMSFQDCANTLSIYCQLCYKVCVISDGSEDCLVV